MKNLTNGAKVNGLGGAMKAMASINLNEMSGNSALEALIKKSTTKVGKEVKFIEGLRKEIIMESFKTQFLTSNLSIGVISNGNSIIVSLFDHPEKAAKALKLALGLKTIGTKKYKGLQAIMAERAGVESDDVNVYCHFITEEVSKCDLASLVTKFSAETIGARIQKECNHIYPLENTMIRKVKMLKSPKVDLAKLMEQHTEVVHKDEGVKAEETVAPLAGSGGRL